MHNLLLLITKTLPSCKRHQTNFIALGIFFLVLLILGIPFTDWWFYGADDSHALFLAYKTKTWQELFYFFYDGHTNQGQTGPSNYLASTARTSFFGTYYRPLCLILYVIEYWLFKANGYAFHLVNVCVHALNTSLFFLILRWFVTSPWALITSLLFAFHPQIAFRFGSIVNLQYYLSLTGILTIGILYKHYLDTNKTRFYLLACLTYIPILFLRESAIVLPVIIFIASYLYLNKKLTTSILPALKNTAPFFLIMLSFLSLRLALYPIAINQSQTGSLCSFLAKTIQTKIPEIQLFIYDLFHLSWLPWGRPWLRGSILLAMLTGTLWLFITNTKKIYVGAGGFIVACMLWPACLGPYSPRYLYEAHPFILVTFMLLIFWHNKPWSLRQRRLGFIILAFIACTQAVFCFINFKNRESKMRILRDAVYTLVNDDAIKNNNRPLCFIGHPFDGFSTQNAQIFWVLLNQPTRTIYFDSATSLISPHANVITSTRWFTIASTYPKDDAYTITPITKGFILTSDDPDLIHFSLMTHGYSLGKKILLREEKTKHGHPVVTQFSLKLETHYLEKNPLFISWSFKNKAFMAI